MTDSVGIINYELGLGVLKVEIIRIAKSEL